MATNPTQPAPTNQTPDAAPLSQGDDFVFPSTIDVRELEKTHTDYDAGRVESYNDLYKAGRSFKQNIDKYLIKRQIEETSATGKINGSAHWEARKKRAHYIPRGAGLIDWLVSEATKDEPEIEAGGDEYWEGLNEDSDGSGTDLPALVKVMARDVMLHGRAYITPVFPYDMAVPAQPNTMAAKMRVIPAETADDWDVDADDHLLWLRTHRIELVRATNEPWKQPTIKRHIWCYITRTRVVEYQYDELLSRPASTPEKLAKKVSETEHGFGQLPVFRVRVPDTICVMDRIYEVLIALFNREVSITWALDQLAYALLVLNLQTTTLDKVVASEIAALVLAVGESADFKTPNPQIFDALFKDCERLKKSLHEVLQAMAVTAASQTQNPRQSATAKAMDIDLLQTLLRAFVNPIRDALEQWIDAVKEFRGEPNLDVKLEGLDLMKAGMEELKELLQIAGGGAQVSKPAPGNEEKNAESEEDGEGQLTPGRKTDTEKKEE